MAPVFIAKEDVMYKMCKSCEESGGGFAGRRITIEITIDFLESLTATDMERIEVYNCLLAEAKEAVSTICAAYSFKIGEDKIVIWKDTHNAEYLTHSGVWQARYFHQTYDLAVTVDSIFNAYKAEYEQRKHLTSGVNNPANSAGYFRSFVQKARWKLKGAEHDGD